MELPALEFGGDPAPYGRAVQRARAKGVPVILVQHVAAASRGIAPLFNVGTSGVKPYHAITQAAPDAPLVVTTFADSRTLASISSHETKN